RTDVASSGSSSREFARRRPGHGSVPPPAWLDHDRDRVVPGGYASARGLSAFAIRVLAGTVSGGRLHQRPQPQALHVPHDLLALELLEEQRPLRIDHALEPPLRPGVHVPERLPLGIEQFVHLHRLWVPRSRAYG